MPGSSDGPQMTYTVMVWGDNRVIVRTIQVSIYNARPVDEARNAMLAEVGLNVEECLQEGAEPRWVYFFNPVSVEVRP